MDKQLSGDFKILGWWQLVGGVAGISMFAFFLTSQVYWSQALSLAFLCMPLIFCYSIFCGYLCFSKKYKAALTCSFINQVLQVFGFAVSGYAFSYIAVLYFGAELDFSKNTSLGLIFGISKFDLQINRDFESASVHFNLVAFILASWKIRLKKRMANYEASATIQAIGSHEKVG